MAKQQQQQQQQQQHKTEAVLNKFNKHFKNGLHKKFSIKRFLKFFLKRNNQGQDLKSHSCFSVSHRRGLQAVF